MATWQFITILTVGMALLWETRPAYTLAYLLLVLFFVLQRWQRKAVSKIIVRRQTRDNIFFPGDQGKVRIQVQNASYFPFSWVSIVDKIPQNLSAGSQREKQVFPLNSRSSYELSFNLRARNRGVYRLGPLDIFVGDFFGISTQKLLIEEFQTVIVYPEVHQLNDLALPSRLSFGNSKALEHINADPTRLAGVRSYQQGDPLRTLHWPATARVGTLQIKQFEHTVTTTCSVFLNLDQRDYEVSSFYVNTELAISTAASLVAHLLNRGEACGLFINGVLTEYLPDNKTNASLLQNGLKGVLQIPARQGMAQLTQLLTVLAGVETQNDINFITLLQNHAQRTEFGSILIWIVPKDTSEVLTQAWYLVRKGRQVQIFVVGEQVTHPELLGQSPSSALQMFLVRSKGAMISWT